MGMLDWHGVINIMTKHAYLPTTIISEKGLIFLFQVIKEVSEALGITLKHATTKTEQTTGMLERRYASLEKALKIKTVERRSMWQRNVNIAVLNYNTSYHACIGSEPCRVSLGQNSCPWFEKRFSSAKNTHPKSTNCRRYPWTNRNSLPRHFCKNTMQAHIKYKAYYDKKTTASKLKERDCSLNKLYRYWSVFCWRDLIKKEIFGTESWNGQNPSASSRETATAHASATHNICTNYATKMKNWSWIHHKHDDLHSRAWDCEYEQPFFWQQSTWTRHT